MSQLLSQFTDHEKFKPLVSDVIQFSISIECDVHNSGSACKPV